MTIGVIWGDIWDEAIWDTTIWAQVPGGDVTAPSLSSPTVDVLGANLVLGHVTTDEGNGRMYWVITTDPTGPSVAQVQAGQDHLGASAISAGNTTVGVTGEISQYAGGLTAETAYYMHWQQQDDAANDSTVVSSSEFTTLAASVGGGSRSRSRFGRSRASGVISILLALVLAASAMVA